MTTTRPRATTFTPWCARPTATITARTCCVSIMPSTTTRIRMRTTRIRTATATTSTENNEMEDAMLTRRGMLHAAGATGASFVAGRAAAAPSTVKTPVDVAVPRGACDCHVHVFSDPNQFPFAPDRVYTPPSASVDDLRALQTALGFERVVIVTPSVYGLDNSCTLDGIRRLGDRARGVAVIDRSTPANVLDELAAGGF